MTPQMLRIHRQCQAFKLWLDKQPAEVDKHELRLQAEEIFRSLMPLKKPKTPKWDNGTIPVNYYARQPIGKE